MKIFYLLVGLTHAFGKFNFSENPYLLVDFFRVHLIEVFEIVLYLHNLQIIKRKGSFQRLRIAQLQLSSNDWKPISQLVRA